MASKMVDVSGQVAPSEENPNPTTVGNNDPRGTTENNPTDSSTPNVQNSGNSYTCLITPSNIHIGQFYIYNFTPEAGRESSPIDSTIVKIPPKYQSPAGSSGPICRICHEGDDKEDLVSPCKCAGTVGLVHKSCMERWLSTRCNDIDRCEICHYRFATIRSPKSFIEFIKSQDNNTTYRRSFMGDVTCFFLLTPLATVSSFLCVEGAKRQILWGNSLESGCLMALATFLVTIYILWNVLTVRFHLRTYCTWRGKHHNVKLVKVQRISTASDGSNRTPNEVIIRSPNHNSSRNVVISLPDSTINTNHSRTF